MPGRPCLRCTKLLPLIVAVYGVLATLLLLYGSELRWAARALPLHLEGLIPAPKEQLLLREGMRLVREGRDIPRAKTLLARSLAIDPYSRSRFFLGEALYRYDADLDAALSEYSRYLEIDPFDLPTYQQISEILRRRGRRAERRALLEGGLAHFNAYVDRYRPQPDRQVAKRFNRRAVQVHERYQTAIRVFSEQLAED